MPPCINRSMTMTLGLCASVFCPLSLAEEVEGESEDRVLELGSTDVVATSLGSTTENNGSYTTGSMSAATRLNLSIKETLQSVSVLSRQKLDDFLLNTLSEAMAHVTGVTVQRAGHRHAGQQCAKRVDGEGFGRVSTGSGGWGATAIERVS